MEIGRPWEDHREVAMAISHNWSFLWDIMGCYGILWDIMGYYGILWDIMGYYGILWDYNHPITEYYGILWDIMFRASVG